jgi:hypothetical protein
MGEIANKFRFVWADKSIVDAGVGVQDSQLPEDIDARRPKLRAETQIGLLAGQGPWKKLESVRSS